MKLERIFIIWILLLSIAYSALSVIRHNHFQSGGFDLGIYDQAVWQYSRFQFPYNTIKERFILGDHLTLTLPLLAPLFWLWEDVRILLVFQAFWISFSALAIYKVAIVRLSGKGRMDPRVRGDDKRGGGDERNNEIVALCLAVVYSLFPGIQYAVFFDFHPVIIGVGLLPWIGYFLESNRKKLLWSAIILLLLTQENMGVALAGLGFIYFIRLRSHSRESGNPEIKDKDWIPDQVGDDRLRRAGIWFMVVGILYSLFALRIIAVFSPAGFEYQPVFPNTIPSFIKQLFDSPEKRQSWFFSFAWFSFLPLLSPGAFLAVALDLSQYFVSGPAFARMWSPFAHHRAIVGVFLTLGTLNVLQWIDKKTGRGWIPAFAGMTKKRISVEYISLILLVVVVVFQYIWHLPLNKLVKAEYWKEEVWMTDNRKLFALVPADASIASQQSLVPHLSHRKEIYLVYPVLHDYDDKRCGQTKCWWLDFAGKPQYLVIDLHPNQWVTQLLETNEHFSEAVVNMEKAGRIRLVNRINNAKLYEVVKK